MKQDFNFFVCENPGGDFIFLQGYPLWFCPRACVLTLPVPWLLPRRAAGQLWCFWGDTRRPCFVSQKRPAGHSKQELWDDDPLLVGKKWKTNWSEEVYSVFFVLFFFVCFGEDFSFERTDVSRDHQCFGGSCACVTSSTSKKKKKCWKKVKYCNTWGLCAKTTGLWG